MRSQHLIHLDLQQKNSKTRHKTNHPHPAVARQAPLRWCSLYYLQFVAPNSLFSFRKIWLAIALCWPGRT
ncbi:hypothetical protein GGP41_006152 [Bipolaris sorokiniana]|uniref:Uncharacterized protein n=1 Tax=Cochliobolus sativus TaxID=45130 RepID=A0A8H5ZJ42_COCSA|nr:hypothetical protein GGP41_006152 [Bipolaris sorokiniana]